MTYIETVKMCQEKVQHYHESQIKKNSINSFIAGLSVGLFVSFCVWFYFINKMP